MKNIALLFLATTLMFSCKDSSIGNIYNELKPSMPRVGGLLLKPIWNPYYNNDSTSKCYGVDIKISKSMVDLGNEIYSDTFVILPDSASAFKSIIVEGTYYYRASTKMYCPINDAPVITKIDSFTHPGGYILEVPISLH